MIVGRHITADDDAGGERGQPRLQVEHPLDGRRDVDQAEKAEHDRRHRRHELDDRLGDLLEPAAGELRQVDGSQNRDGHRRARARRR